MEEGEILLNPSQAVSSSHLREAHDTYQHEHSSSGGYAHDESYEWPWDSAVERHALLPQAENSEAPIASHPTSRKTCLRLLVLESRIISKAHRVAVVDGYPEVQLGRDAPASDTIPRIRLKEMEASKLHATIYWDQTWEGWGIVDMGSTHGTYLRSATGHSQAVERNIRLSAPKTASIPRRLYHLDQLTLGSTTFVVHVHEEGSPCEECSPGLGEEISLFATARKRSVTKPHPGPGQDTDREAVWSHIRRTRGPKAALSQLRRDLLSKRGSESSEQSSRQYVDRSARRRALYPSSVPDTPGVSALPPPSSQSFVPADRPPSETSSQREPVSQPAVPVPASSIGHKLLVKQGWNPGTGLGITEGGRVEPLILKVSLDRSGLGSRSMPNTSKMGKG